MFPCALVGPLFPPPPAPCHLYVPFLCVRPSCRCFCLFLCSRSLLLPRALRVPSALLLVTLVPLPCAPSLARLPSHSPSRCRPCLRVCPPCPCSAVTRVCHSRALPLPLPLAPTLSPGCSLGPRLSPHPGCLAPCVCVCGGGVSVVWTVALYPPCAPSQQGVEVRNAGHCGAVAPVVEVPAAVRSPLVVPVLAPTPGVLASLHLSSRHRAIFVDYGTCSLLYLQSDTGNAVPPPPLWCEDTEYTQCIRSSQ